MSGVETKVRANVDELATWDGALVAAENGREALEVFEAKRPDVVTMDIMMPKLNGIESLRRIKDRSPETTIVMVTSVSQNEKMREAARAGADGYVTKPVDTEALREEFDDVLDFPVTR